MIVKCWLVHYDISSVYTVENEWMNLFVIAFKVIKIISLTLLNQSVCLGN